MKTATAQAPSILTRRSWLTGHRTPDTAGGEEVFQNSYYTGNTTSGHSELFGIGNIRYTDPDTGTYVYLTPPGGIVYSIVTDTATGDKYMLTRFYTDEAAQWFAGLANTIPEGAPTLITSGGNAAFISTSGTTSIICFCRGTLILTDQGKKAVEDITSEDRVHTLDHGFQQVRWIHKSKVQFIEHSDKNRPIRITAGALGLGMPERDLLVSPQHRMMVSSVIAKRVTGAGEVLIAAKNLTALPGVSVEQDIAEVEYWHFFCDQHEIVLAEGAPSETLHLGKEAIKSLSKEETDELADLFPAVLTKHFDPQLARSIANKKDATSITARHIKNNKPLISQMTV